VKNTTYVLGFFIVFVSAVWAAEFQINKDKDREVKFISDAPGEKIEGITDKIDGYLFWQGTDTLNTSELFFEVDLNSIDTGIGLRNRHMRDNYLETDKFPFARYSAKAAGIKWSTNGENFEVQTRGKLLLHGVERDVDVDGTVSPVEDGFLIECRFDIALSDYEIKIPKLMFLKVSEIIALEVRFHVEEAKE
jgi:polyisoprenoid-binding protein YceI